MSKEYIERGMVLEYLNADLEADLQPVVVMEFVESIPAADVVEVVRCSECRFNVANMEIDPLDDTDYSGRDIVCGRFLTDGMHSDDYCSYGERGGADNAAD